MLGLGFCFCTVPIVKRFYKDKQRCSFFLKRHLDFFNAHPYFASWALGAVAREEEKAYTTGTTDTKAIQTFKERMAGPLGVLGDQLFWSRIKPLTAGIGVLLALTIGYGAVVIFLVLYNVPHIYVRIKGLLLGYKNGFNVASYLSMQRFRGLLKALNIISMILCGLLFMAAAKWSFVQNYSVLAAFIVSAGLTFSLLKMGKSINFIMLVISLVGLVTGFLFSIAG